MMEDKFIDESILFDEAKYIQCCAIYLHYMKNLINAASKQYGYQMDTNCFNSYHSLNNSIGISDKDASIEHNDTSKCSSFTKTSVINCNSSSNQIKLLNKPITKKITVIIDDSKSNEEEESTTEGHQCLQKKTKRMTKMCTDCPHKYAKHYAKNMCSNCYHSKGKLKKPWNCPHDSKTHYALGLCQNCYQMNYIKNKQN